MVQPSLLEAETVRAAIPTAKADYPRKLVRIIEPFGPGSGPEVIATLWVASSLSCGAGP